MSWTSVNLVDFVFINFIVTITIFGTLINFVEPYLPVLITQTFRYGKCSYKGAPNRLVQMCEVPKSWFSHFYAFALLWSITCMYFVVYVYVGNYPLPEPAMWVLDLLCGGAKRSIRSNPSTTFLAALLMFIQTVRRFYETHFVQIFSSTSRINITHYMVGYFHYFGVFLAILSQAKAFVRESIVVSDDSTATVLKLSDVGVIQWIGVGIFLYSWYHQFMTNLILANLRKNKTGVVVTQKHLLPHGGYFEKISSPHMFFEVLMYISLYLIIPNNSSWLFVVCWVITNQIENAWLMHKWYLATFPDYPRSRCAIFPRCL